MVFWLYNLLIVMASPLWGVWLLWRLFGLRKDRRGFRQRWCGLDASSVQAARERFLDQTASSIRIWIHAVSVGEAMAMAPLVRALRQRYPEALLVGSTVTDLGQEAMRTKLPELDLVLDEILVDKNLFYNNWTKACSLYVAKKSELPLKKPLVTKYIHAENLVLKETAAFAAGI